MVYWLFRHFKCTVHQISGGCQLIGYSDILKCLFSITGSTDCLFINLLNILSVQSTLISLGDLIHWFFRHLKGLVHYHRLLEFLLMSMLHYCCFYHYCSRAIRVDRIATLAMLLLLLLFLPLLFSCYKS